MSHCITVDTPTCYPIDPPTHNSVQMQPARYACMFPTYDIEIDEPSDPDDTVTQEQKAMIEQADADGDAGAGVDDGAGGGKTFDENTTQVSIWPRLPNILTTDVRVYSRPTTHQPRLTTLPPTSHATPVRPQ